jgi:hypothetical protein
LRCILREHPVGIVAALTPASGLTQVVATPPYSVTTFATAPRGMSAPDSATFSPTNVFIGYDNRVRRMAPG